jgi:pimeloyl-ACP methyl ester carboxylesterase
MLAMLWLGQGCRTAAPPSPASPAVESRSAPAVEPRSAPAAEPRSAPAVESRSAPAAEPRSALGVDADVPAGFRAEWQEAPVFGGQVFTIEGGQLAASTVVLVHGLGENGLRDFYPVLGPLAASYHVFAFDLPGFGRSTHGTSLYSPERYAQFIHALVRQHFAAPFNLVGHSMGGAISLMLAARFPADVQRLFLIDAAGFLHRKAYVNFAVSAGLDNVLGIFAGPGKELLDATLQAAALAVGPLPTAPEPDFLLANDWLRSSVLATPTRIAALATVLENFGPAIAEVKAPTWILWGRDDPIASPRTAEILAKRLPGARLEMLEKAGHDPMLTKPAAVSRFLLEGLAAAPVPKAAIGQPPLSPEAGPGRCDGQRGAQFRGDYSEIEIASCRDVLLDGVRSGPIRIRDSVVTIQNTEAHALAVALDVKNSKLEVTASDFVGDVALEVSGSDLDLAGVVLRGDQRSVHVGGSSQLIFSISHLDSPVGRHYVHELLELRAGEEM